MKVRACVTVAVIAAGLSWSAAAGAQGAAKEAPRKEAPRVDIVDVARFFTAPSALGHAWQHAVQAVLDGMRALVDVERTAAQPAPAPPLATRAPTWTAALPAVRVREAAGPLAVHPVVVEPVTEIGADARLQRAVLLGASAQLPWNVP